ncbi:MAG: sec-independent protein translocase protein TatB [Gammaproteobacteria bacterium]|jgi:sec-independent protein translocase protein TatB
MFDIGFSELILIGVMSLLIMGPERLPGAIRTSSLWIARLRRSFSQIKAEIEREVGADDIKQQLHNETILQNLKDSNSDLLDSAKEFKSDIEKIGDQLPYDISDVLDNTAKDIEPKDNDKPKQ